MPGEANPLTYAGPGGARSAAARESGYRFTRMSRRWSSAARAKTGRSGCHSYRMVRHRRRLPVPRNPSGPPPLIVALLAIELLVVAVLLKSGVGAGDLLKSAGPAITLTIAFLNPTVQELGRRKPKLTVRASEAGSRGVVAAPALRPWPIDAERIVSNELADARQTLEVRPAVLDTFAALTDPFGVRPSAAEHERAKKAFHEKLAEYETDLRTWLADYEQASRARADTFQLTLRLESAQSGAHADAITVVLDPPEGAEVVDDLPEVAPPPDQPSYQPPLPRRVSEIGRVADYRSLISVPGLIGSAPPVFRPPESWAAVDNGRRLEAAIGDVQAGRSLALGDALLIRVARPGRHEVGWTIFSKSLRRAASGTLVLDLPADPDRPAIGRLHGILTFPDVPIVDDEFDDEDGGEDEDDTFGPKHVARRKARSTDPPGPPCRSETADHTGDDGDGSEPSDGDVDSVIRRLNEAAAWWEWRALGLDPAHDGPDRVEVRQAERVDAD